MTKDLVIADPAAWARTFSAFKAARADYESLTEPAVKSEIHEAADKLIYAEEALLALHAPDLSAAIEKLMVIFEEDLWDETREGDRKRMVIGDLRRFAALQA